MAFHTGLALREDFDAAEGLTIERIDYVADDETGAAYIIIRFTNGDRLELKAEAVGSG